MTEMGFLIPSSAQRTTTRSEHISASSAWWRSSATVLWLTRSYRCDPHVLIIIGVIVVLFVIEMFKLNHIEKSTTCLTVCALLSTQSNGDLKRKWTWAVEWLGDELERRPYTGNPQYTYNNWSPPVQSNETSNGYFLERSHSARMTLAKACELCPEEVTTSYPLTHSRTCLANIIVIFIF